MGKRGPKPKIQSPELIPPVNDAPVTTPAAPVDAVPNAAIILPTAQTQPIISAQTATSDCWRYHETEEPRIFKAGEAIPEGWHASMKPLTRSWVNTIDGKWARKNRG